MTPSKIKLWQLYGLEPRAAKLAEEAMPLLMQVVEIVGGEIAKIALDEAIFQVVELPKRNQAFQKKRQWRPERKS